MMKTLAAVVACLLVPGLAAAQYGDAPPAYYAPPPAGPPPGYAQPAAPPGYYSSREQYAPPEPSANLEGLALSAALGYGTAFGGLMKDGSGNDLTMSDGISGQIPLSLGVGYRANPLFSFGVAFQYAPLTTKNCDPGSSCSASDTRIGVEGRLHLVAEQSFSPWLSGGIGYEWFSLSESGAYVGDLTLKGLDFEFQAGGDFRVNSTFTLGPYLGLRFGTYDSASSGSASADIPDANQTSHGWVTFGIRGAFTI